MVADDVPSIRIDLTIMLLIAIYSIQGRTEFPISCSEFGIPVGRVVSCFVRVPLIGRHTKTIII